MKSRLALLALSTSVLLAACGGGGGGGSPATDTSSPGAPPAPAPSPISAPSANDPSGILLLAGAPGGPGNIDGSGAQARFSPSPKGFTHDAAGNVYVADTGSQLIRRITVDGVVTTVAGTRTPRAPGAPAAADGAPGTARFASPVSVTRDADGNLYVSDGNAIRKVDPAGNVTTLAGVLPVCASFSDVVTGVDCSAATSASAGFVDGTGAAARFHDPEGLAVDAAGNVYVADLGNYAIRKITPAGVVTTLAGGVRSVAQSRDGTGLGAWFNHPNDVAVTADGTVYVTDWDIIRKVTPDGVVTTIAGSAAPGVASGDPRFSDGTGSAALFGFVASLAFDPAGNLLVSDTNNQAIRKVTLQGVVTTVLTQIQAQGEIDVDPAGNVVFTPGSTVRRITPGGVIIYGSESQPGNADGIVDTARFSRPGAVAVDPAGNALVVEGGPSGYSGDLRSVTPDGRVTTLFGPSQATAGGITVDASGNTAVAGYRVVYKMPASGALVPIAGGCIDRAPVTNLPVYYKDGPALSACFSTDIEGLVYNAKGELLIADAGNHVIRKLGTDGTVSTFAGQAGVSGSADGSSGVATFSYPRALAMDASGNLYVSDGNTIRKVTPAGDVSTFAGAAGACAYADGTRDQARFCNITGIAFDARGNLHVADGGNNVIRQIAPDGTVSTVVGIAGFVGLRTGPLPGTLPTPNGLAVVPPVAGDSRTRLVVTTSENALVRITLP